MTDVRAEVSDLLVHVQSTSHGENHSRAQLHQLLNENGPELSKIVTELISPVFLILKKDVRVDRIFNFLSGAIKGSISLPERDESSISFLHHLVAFLILILKSPTKSVRLRALQLLSKSLTKLDEVDPEFELDDALTESLIGALSERMKDKIASIRCLAVQCGALFQDCEDENDEMLLELIRIVLSDPSHTVRLAALNNLGISSITVPSVLSRCKDANDNIRYSAFRIVRSKIPLQILSIQSRVEVLIGGIRDRSPAIKELAANIVYEWWELQSAADAGVFVSKLGADLFPDEVSEILLCLFRRISGSVDLFTNCCSAFAIYPKNIASGIDLDKACILFHMLVVAMERNSEDAIEMLVPDTISFCEYIDMLWIDFKASQAPILAFLIKSLSLLVTVTRDEMQRQRILVSTQAILTDLRECSTQTLDSLLGELVHSIIKSKMQESVFEVLSELQEKITFENIGDYGNEEALERWFSVCEATLQYLPLEQANLGVELQSMFSLTSFAQGATHPSWTIRFKAIRCLTLFTILRRDRAMALSQIPVFVKLIEKDHEQVKRTSLECCFDLLLAFNLFEEFDAILESTTDLNDVFFTAILGLCKLLLNGAVQIEKSIDVFSNLLMFLVSPDFEGDDHLHQLFSAFFPNFVVMIKQCDLILLRSVSQFTFSILQNQDCDQRRTLVEGLKCIKLMIMQRASEEAQMDRILTLEEEFIQEILGLTASLARIFDHVNNATFQPLKSALGFFEPRNENVEYFCKVVDICLNSIPKDTRCSQFYRSLLVDWNLKLENLDESIVLMEESLVDKSLIEFKRRLSQLKKKVEDLEDQHAAREEFVNDVFEVAPGDVGEFDDLPDDFSESTADNELEFDF